MMGLLNGVPSMQSSPIKANNIMLDLETLSVSVTPMLLQVSMVAFHLDVETGNATLVSTFDCYPSMEEQESAGADINSQTVNWWMNKNSDKFLQLMKNTKIPLNEFKECFETFIRSCDNPKIWARSPSFDCSKISALWGMFYQKEAPWKFWQEMDVRTVCGMFDIDGNFGGTPQGRHIWTDILEGREKHDAFYDCFVQSNCVIEAYKRLAEMKKKVQHN
jgi:hypothetical protein